MLFKFRRILFLRQLYFLFVVLVSRDHKQKQACLGAGRQLHLSICMPPCGLRYPCWCMVLPLLVLLLTPPLLRCRSHNALKKAERGPAPLRPARVKFQRSESPEARRSIRCSCMEIATTTRPSVPPSAYVLADKRVRGCLLLCCISSALPMPIPIRPSSLFPRSPFRLFPHPIEEDDDDD